MKRRTRGFTLIELVLAITIIGVVSTTLMGAMTAVSARSGDSVMATQAAIVANAYLQEIMSQPYADLNADGETLRSDFDDVDDYNGLTDQGAQDRSGVAIAGLSGYRISVAVNLVNWAGVPAKLIVVTVTDPQGRATLVSAYRTDHR
jgi:MSHA pilin protein MshD